ncbi:MAG: L,D-transpeptidase family protein [Zoogloeaceae bacterium]|jgi:murein L,D-transpeptidase YafK|nr:L,D-transpeptidase family protein [Zoogloeaceae bacterium]
MENHRGNFPLMVKKRKTGWICLIIALVTGAMMFYLREHPAPVPAPESESEATTAAQQATAPEPPIVIGDDPEAALSEIYADIHDERLDRAQQRVDALIAKFPTFRLAYLIRGDLLLARVQPVAALDNADLRDEAIRRLRGYAHKPPVDAVPRSLIKLAEDDPYAIVVDTDNSRLYVYENTPDHPKLVADYYVTQGKLGADKWSEGDKRTPLGVYHVTSFLPPAKLPDMYGHGAWPLNYPNEWDKRRGRGGSGIWLHGSPSSTYSRPPKASDGCVVLSNADFDRMEKFIRVGKTPVVFGRAIQWEPAADWKKTQAEMSQAIERWRADWQALDAERYLTHYSRDFKSGNRDFSAFTKQKTAAIQAKKWIKVGVSNLSLFYYPSKDEVIVATFTQSYESHNYQEVMQKRQYWKKEDGQWKIVYEGAA